MTVDKLSRLFAALGQSSQGFNSQDTKAQEVKVSKSFVSEAAVELSSSFDAQKSGDGGRAKRIAEIKAAVDNGTYKVDSQKIAESFIREIFT